MSPNNLIDWCVAYNYFVHNIFRLGGLLEQVVYLLSKGLYGASGYQHGINLYELVACF